MRENITLALQSQRGMLRRISTARSASSRRAGSRRSASARPTSDRPPARSRAAISRRCCSPGCSHSRPACSLLDEPTRGIDVGAKVEVQNLVGDLADNGMSVIFISAELEEVLRVASRIAVLRDGQIVDTLPSDELDRRLPARHGRPSPMTSE